MARKMQDMLLPTMAAYADLGRGLYQGMLKKSKASSSRRGGRKGKPHRKR
jgi:hypothetical protein